MEQTIITTLELTKSLKNQTLRLIERSFNYSSQNSFEVDFFPLMNEANHHNCFVLVEQNEVKAHIGALPVSFDVNGHHHQVVFYGGICVDASSQGKGYFRKLYEFVTDQFSEMCLHFLWSEKIELYQKFGFFPAISQYQYPQSQSNHGDYQQVSLESLTTLELKQLQKLYHSSHETRVSRDEQHWHTLSKIKSSKLYIKKQDGKILNYFFIGKGEDLDGIIHEYGTISEKDLREMTNYGTVWSSQFFENVEAEAQFGALVKIGNPHKFKKFVTDYSKGIFEIEKVDDVLVHFKYEQNTLSMSQHEFLQGLMGPGIFQELGQVRPITISGLDSI